MKFVDIVAQGATPLALDNVRDRTMFGVDDPNPPLNGQLRKDGIDVAVCGRAWAGSISLMHGRTAAPCMHCPGAPRP